VVHNSRRLLKELNALLLGAHSSCQFETSDVRKDGTVIVKCRSTTNASAVETAERMAFDLTMCCIDFTQVDDVRLSVPIAQFEPVVDAEENE